jgi:beta-ketoacyl-acyl-carrier-protein synthase II
MNYRVVITGIGLKTPVGNSVDAFWQNINEGNHGVKLIAESPRSDKIAPYPDNIKVAALDDDFDPLEYFEKKELRRFDPFTHFAVAAAKDALADSKTDLADIDPYRVGVIIGSGIGGINTFQDQHRTYMEKGPSRVSVFFIPSMISNMAAGQIAITHGFKGANYCPVTACASSAHAVGEAFRQIKHGYLTAAITGGAEAATTGFALAGFDNMGALTRSDDPARASIPFDADRSGFVLGEGAGMLILEELEHAKARGAHIYAEVVGYGATADAYHITSPSPNGEGAAAAMEHAIKEAGAEPNEVGYINAHGTSTPLNDKYETIAIKSVFGENAPPTSSTKSMTGHMLGAAGAVEAAVCALAIENGLLPPTVGYQTADTECDLDVVPNTARKADIKYAISNSLGFGGHNASLAFKKYTP